MNKLKKEQILGLLNNEVFAKYKRYIIALSEGENIDDVNDIYLPEAIKTKLNSYIKYLDDKYEHKKEVKVTKEEVKEAIKDDMPEKKVYKKEKKDE